MADDFAIAFAEQFYQRLFDGAQPVDTALARAVPAAALIFHLIGAGFSQQKAIVELAAEVGTTASEELPATVAQVTELVERWEGVCFQKLLERLSPGPGSADAAQDGEPLSEDVATALDQLAEITDWGALVAALRRIIAGDRDEQALLVGLDGTDTVIVRNVLSRIVGDRSHDCPLQLHRRPR